MGKSNRKHPLKDEQYEVERATIWWALDEVHKGCINFNPQSRLSLDKAATILSTEEKDRRHSIKDQPSMTAEDEMDVEQSEREKQMMEDIKEFLEGGCKCSRGPKDGPSSSQFTGEEIITDLNNCHEFSSRELDLMILANIQAVTSVKAVGQQRNKSPHCNFL